jgi:hypothetical protein
VKAKRPATDGPVNALRRAASALTSVDVVFCVAVGAAVVAVILRGRRSDRPPLAGAGDDKPPGYENPTTGGTVQRGSALSP